MTTSVLETRAFPTDWNQNVKMQRAASLCLGHPEVCLHIAKQSSKWQLFYYCGINMVKISGGVVG
jgi:hypothetical protein